MIVIADTSPINYLVLVGEIRVLPQLYCAVVIPPSVVDELRDWDAPEQVRNWIENPPAWLLVKAPLPSNDRRLLELDSGERDAIALALQLKADLVLIDERDARSVAKMCGLSVAGTLRVLASAASQNLVNLDLAFELLRKTNFRADPSLFAELLAQHKARK